MHLRGFSLVELLLALAIAAILLILGVPSLVSLPEQDRATAALNHIIGAVSFARSAAVLQRAPVTLCPAANGQCLARDQWHRGALIFRDPNENGLREPGEPILSELPALQDGARLYWRSFRNRSYLRFLPVGYTQWQNGHFLYCNRDADATLTRMLIVNAQGRTRVAPDSDGDGIVEDARGRPVACP